MNIRLGIYEIFSRIVPGGVYIAAIVQLLVVLRVITIDLQALNNISLIASLGLAVAAYVVGGALNPFSLMWLKLFRIHGASQYALTAFKKAHHDDWQIDWQDKDSPILMAFLRTKNLELAGDIERQMAISIMMRNVSLGLGLMAVNFIVSYIIGRAMQDIFVAVLLAIVSMLAMRESITFRRWYYDALFQTTLAYRIDLEKLIKPKPSGMKHRPEDKQEM